MYRIALLLLIIALLVNAAREIARDSNGDEARIGFSAKLWGRHQWLLLHIMALNVPREFGAACRSLERHLYSLQHVLPCSECRHELGLMMKALPPREFLKHGRAGAVAYIYVLHCAVSDRTKGVDCGYKFLEEEPVYLTEYVKQGGVDVTEVMQELHEDSETKGIYWQIEEAKIKLRRLLEERARSQHLEPDEF